MDEAGSEVVTAGEEVDAAGLVVSAAELESAAGVVVSAAVPPRVTPPSESWRLLIW